MLVLVVMPLNEKLPIKEEADAAHPDGGHEHQDHVDIGKVAHEQAWDEDGEDDYDSSHRRRAGLLHLAFEAEVADGLADLPLLEPVDDGLPEEEGAHHCDGERDAGAERNVVHQVMSREVAVGKVLK